MVMIKNFEMPECCYYCSICSDKEDYATGCIDYKCLLLGDLINDEYVKERRYSKCPLVEINEKN